MLGAAMIYTAFAILLAAAIGPLQAQSEPPTVRRDGTSTTVAILSPEIQHTRLWFYLMSRCLKSTALKSCRQ
jgi:hypothetical protein